MGVDAGTDEPAAVDAAAENATDDVAAERGTEDAVIDGPPCGESPVWTTASLSFTLTSSGGFTPRPPEDVGCAFTSVTYDFSAPDNTLAEQACRYTGRSDRLVNLTREDVASIIANVSAIRTTCMKGCGADAPSMALTVRASGVQSIYRSNFYAGCPGRTDPPPFVAFDLLGALENLLYRVVAGACDSADAGTADAGRCVTR